MKAKPIYPPHVAKFLETLREDLTRIGDLGEAVDTIRRLADALISTAMRNDRSTGPCWCPRRSAGHFPACAYRRAALRRAGRLP